MNHVFVSKEIADTEYPTALGKTIFVGERYWTTKEDLEGKDFYIIDQKGVETFDYERLEKESNTEVRVIYVKENWYVRLWHMIKRGDSLKSALGRLKNDYKVYDDKYLENIAYATLYGSNALYNYFKEVFKNDKKFL